MRTFLKIKNSRKAVKGGYFKNDITPQNSMTQSNYFQNLQGRKRIVLKAWYNIFV